METKRESSPLLLREERETVVEMGKKLVTLRLTRGTGGNVSVLSREKGLFAVSPSGMDYFETRPEDVVVLDLEGRVVDGKRRPSSESGMHRLLYRERPDVAAVVHTHSTFATALACTGQDLPPVHYLIGFAGPDVRCIPYETFGTEALARAACRGMEGRCAVLLGNHGLLAAGPTPDYALSTAEEIEFVCEVYCRAKAFGTPVLLGRSEMETVMEKFRTYGQKQA